MDKRVNRAMFLLAAAEYYYEEAEEESRLEEAAAEEEARREEEESDRKRPRTFLEDYLDMDLPDDYWKESDDEDEDYDSDYYDDEEYKGRLSFVHKEIIKKASKQKT